MHRVKRLGIDASGGGLPMFLSFGQRKRFAPPVHLRAKWRAANLFMTRKIKSRRPQAAAVYDEKNHNPEKVERNAKNILSHETFQSHRRDVAEPRDRRGK
jgi:hypothetical protein